MSCQPVVDRLSDVETHLGTVNRRSPTDRDQYIDFVFLCQFLRSLDLLDRCSVVSCALSKLPVDSRACCPISLNTPPNMPSFSNNFVTSAMTGVFSRKLFPVTINALGFAFLSYVETRVRMIDGRLEMLPGPQWTARRGVKRYEPDEGSSDRAIV